MRTLRSLVPLFLVLLVVSRAQAEGDETRARALFKEGEAAYSAGRYDAAAASFEAAYAEVHNSALLWNIAQSYKRQFAIDQDPRLLRRARAVFENYRTVRPEARAEADGEIQEIDETLRVLPPEAPRPTRPEPPAAVPEAPHATAVVAVTAPADQPKPARSRKWVWIPIAGAVVVVGAVALALGLTLHSTPSPTLGAIPGN